MNKNITYIYSLIDPETNEIRYIGKSNNPKNRLVDHIRKSKYSNVYKNRWISKLKEKNLSPIMNIIESVCNDMWSEREKYWIKYYKDMGCKLTNLTDGGDGGNFGNDVNKKISEKLKGRKFTPETLKLMSESAKKRIISDEGRKTLSEYRKGSKNSMFGKKQTNFCIESKYKPVTQLTLDGEVIKTWKSLKEVSEYLLINRNSIRMVCNGQRKTAGGYKWKFNI
jgi:hypothetical protein